MQHDCCIYFDKLKSCIYLGEWFWPRRDDYQKRPWKLSLRQIRRPSEEQCALTALIRMVNFHLHEDAEWGWGPVLRPRHIFASMRISVLSRPRVLEKQSCLCSRQMGSGPHLLGGITWLLLVCVCMINSNKWIISVCSTTPFFQKKQSSNT